MKRMKGINSKHTCTIDCTMYQQLRYNCQYNSVPYNTDRMKSIESSIMARVDACTHVKYSITVQDIEINIQCTWKYVGTY